VIAIDTSALIAILLHEPERDTFFDRIADAEARTVSAVTVLEAGLVMFGRLGPAGVSDVLDFLTVIDAEIIPFDAHQAQLALMAFTRYGKGVNAKSRLNMGDCASYVVAKSLNIPLLFKGNDFPETDIIGAV
jgi:ribonuclease VapC